MYCGNGINMRKSTKGEWIAFILTAIWAAVIVGIIYKSYYEYLFIEDVKNKLREIPEIADVYKVQGIYDIIASLI